MTALLAGAIGLLVMFGWALDISWIKSGLPHTVRMRPAAASALVLAASSLFIVASHVHRKLKRLATLLASAVMALGLFPLGRYALLGWGGSAPTSGVDLGSSYLASSPSMSPLSALSVAAIGLALITLSLGRFKRLTQLMASLAAAIGMAVVLRYLWAGDEVVFRGILTPMGVHSALAFLLIGTGT
ncbi:MAG: hypothetical protein JWP52_2148, partial [Rhizobacter sp.]|nr:hypothetical protein [Rhizobacter sp.]